LTWTNTAQNYTKSWNKDNPYKGAGKDDFETLKLFSLETALRLKNTMYLISFGGEWDKPLVTVDAKMKDRFKILTPISIGTRQAVTNNIGKGLQLALNVQEKLCPYNDEWGYLTCPYYVDYVAGITSIFTTEDHRNHFWKELWTEAQNNANLVIFLASAAWVNSSYCNEEYSLWTKSTCNGLVFTFKDTPQHTFAPENQKKKKLTIVKIEGNAHDGETVVDLITSNIRKYLQDQNW